MRRILAIALWAALAGYFAVAFSASAPAPMTTRPYWVCSVDRLAARDCPHTHVAVTGIVDYARLEDDGDRHIRLRQGAGDTLFVIAECLPELPCTSPHAGDTVTVRGISRVDAEHGWSEVHPVELLTTP